MSLKIGLKIWSTNEAYFKPALELFSRGVFDYIELFTVPDSNVSIDLWAGSSVPYVLHAPHSYEGLNLSIPDFLEKNRSLISLVDRYRNSLHPQFTVFHPGISGSTDETIRQLNLFKNEYPLLFNQVIIENKPKYGLKGELCVGCRPGQIQKIIDETGLGFCLDYGHAIAAAAAENVDYKEYVADLLSLKPVMFHLSDGMVESIQDSHLHIGQGNYDIKWFLQAIGDNQLVSIETIKDHPSRLDDFEKDVINLRNCADEKN